jgi:hypothetical protein
MFKQMIQYYNPLFISIKTMLGYKSSMYLTPAISISIIIESMMLFFQQSFLGVSVSLITVISTFIILDQLLGTAASLKIAEQAKKDNDKQLYEDKKFKSTKVSFTIFKFMSLFLWLLLAFTANEYVKDSITLPIIEGLTMIPLLLFGFREYISIGESIEVLYGNKPYLFTLGEKIFQLLQFNFLRKIKDE